MQCVVIRGCGSTPCKIANPAYGKRWAGIKITQFHQVPAEDMLLLTGVQGNLRQADKTEKVKQVGDTALFLFTDLMKVEKQK